ncbi:MAG: RsmB/NOP family class I SAM-dependent RNA methyltransferase [SAR324 cluster bacterium]|nr:RsmB/NOP family class I SAM-dependent RNA methyltransferase [SAR324 cluster bacterium]
MNPSFLSQEQSLLQNAFPQQFLERMERLIPETHRLETINALTQPLHTGFRINPLKTKVQEVLGELQKLDIQVEPVEWNPEAFLAKPEDREKLLQSQSWSSGKIYVQNLSSMVPPLVLAPEPDSRILDLTAAPGGKTLQLAGMIQNRGEIWAVEKSKDRFFRLRSNVEQQGATCVKCYLGDGEVWWKKNSEAFDYVLLDAPCSTEAQLHISDPEACGQWNLKKSKTLMSTQKSLMFSAIQCLKPGGSLVYSTCSLAPEENELVLDRMLHVFDTALEITPVSLNIPNQCPGLTHWPRKPLNPMLENAVRILPTRRMEGFFISRILKIKSTLQAT